jgi:hypothetical protein
MMEDERVAHVFMRSAGFSKKNTNFCGVPATMVAAFSYCGGILRI